MIVEVRATFLDGSVWSIPAKIIAEDRARYYQEEHGASFDEEVNIALEDDYELEDWSKNNMNWSDLKEHAKMITPPVPCDYDKTWDEATLETF